MALIEVYGGQISLAFELTTALVVMAAFDDDHVKQPFCIVTCVSQTKDT